MAKQLECLISRSKSFFLPRHPKYSAFYERIEFWLSRNRSAPTPCLMSESAVLREKGVATVSTQVPKQIGFWLFVLKDAVELHVARTLVLIAAHSDVQDRILEEIPNGQMMTTPAIDSLHFLEACVREGLRLWTPVPLLLRRAVEDFSLRDEIPIAAEQQILIHAGFYHRDRSVFGEIANRFSPHSVASSPPLPPVYYFSDGRQSCAGQFLARFLLKATLASLFAKFRFTLVGPRIVLDAIPYSYDHFKVKFALQPRR